MKNQVVFFCSVDIDEREPPRSRTLVLLALLALGGTGVQSAPLEKLIPRAVGCPPYTHLDSSSSRCVDCAGEQFKCHAGWELKEDCGYSPEGYHVADACRQCPNGTYSEGTYLTGAGQNHGQCQDCKTCPSGYEQECNPKQQAVCQEMLVCCLCLYDDPNPQDVIYECQLQYPGTRYYCKDSISTGYTCTRPPQAMTTVVPHPVSSPTQTTVNASQIVPTTDTTNSSKAPPPSPTYRTSSESEPPTTSHPTGESSTTDKNGTVTPALKGKSKLPWIWFVVIAACVLIGSAITCYCCREKIAACILKPKDVKFNRLEEAVSEDEGEQQKGELTENTKHAGQGKEVDNSCGADSGNVSQESSDAGSDKRDSQCSSEDSLLEGGQEEDNAPEREQSDSEEGGSLDNESETSPKEVGAGPEETMRFARRIEGPPNDEKSLKAVPFEGEVDLPGGSRSPRDNTADPATSISGAQGFSNPSVPIQVPGFIQRMPLETILNEEDLFNDLRIKLEQSDRHFRYIGSHFGLTHEELDHIEFVELRGKDSPLKAILEKVIQTNQNRTVGELLQYCNEKIRRRDVVRTVVKYFVEKEQQNQKSDKEVKEGGEVRDSQSQQLDKCTCSKSDNKDIELKKLVLQSTATDVPEESMSEQSVAQEKLGTCDVNRDAFELMEM